MYYTKKQMSNDKLIIKRINSTTVVDSIDHGRGCAQEGAITTLGGEKHISSSRPCPVPGHIEIWIQQIEALYSRALDASTPIPAYISDPTPIPPPLRIRHASPGTHPPRENLTSTRKHACSVHFKKEEG